MEDLVTGASFFMRFTIHDLAQQGGLSRTLFQKMDNSAPSDGIAVKVGPTGKLVVIIKRDGTEYKNETAADTIAVDTVYDLWITYAVSGNAVKVYLNNVDKTLSASSDTNNFPATPINNARYVRVTVNGNTLNEWAAITEIDVFDSDCITNLPISAVTASANDTGYPPSNVIDNNLATRWSSRGVGQYVTVDLGSTQNICSVDIAWYQGNIRTNNFIISTSTDGVTFTTQYTGTSGGATLDEETYAITPVTAALDLYVFRRGAGFEGYTYGDLYDFRIYREKVVSAAEVGYMYTNKWTISDIPFGQITIADYFAAFGSPAIPNPPSFTSASFSPTSFSM